MCTLHAKTIVQHIPALSSDSVFSLQVVEMGCDKAPTVTLTNNLKVTYTEMNHAKRKQIAETEGGEEQTRSSVQQLAPVSLFAFSLTSAMISPFSAWT